MVVCVCNAIREREVREAARGGATSACQAYRALGRQPKCGQCVSFARAIIDEERAAA
jgi:bacterioferritin-associated ferredoxin